jgi:Lar family restriction alleviation protein
MELKCCPFCQSTDVVAERITIRGTDFWNVVCQSCEGQGPDGGTEQLAVDSWNTRPINYELLEALVAYVKDGSCRETWDKVVNVVEKITGKTIAEIRR